MGPQGALGATKLLRPFSEVIYSLELKDPFIRNWVDLVSFLLAGVKTNGILSAEMVYMFAEWYKPGSCLEYPLHGTGAVVDALVQGMKKFGGRLSLGSILQFVRAKKAVISNASMWDTLKLLPKEVVPKSYLDRVNTTPQCESFMHLHLGFDAEVQNSGLIEDQSSEALEVDFANKFIGEEFTELDFQADIVLSHLSRQRQRNVRVTWEGLEIKCSALGFCSWKSSALDYNVLVGTVT
ncbi:hypothetical protein SO802_004266 [Lithocarpus litseifolius]|uniref:Uncharacterized protein n=1 Tax=Lithocarpus litseifolius TaxID=425828 RepID=A0AAW2E2F5_9ROSI